MALYQTISVIWKLAKSSSLAQLLSSRSIVHTDSASLEECDGKFLKVADGVVDLAVNLGGVTTCKSLLLESSRQLTVKLNGEPITVGHTAAEGGTLLLTACSLTSLSLTNASGDVAEVYLCTPGV